jgi:ribose 5-phosphate isomerase B
MNVGIGSDHAGFEAKERVKKALEAAGHAVRDFGTNSAESCDYPDFAAAVAGAVASGQCERGVLVCGTGIGMSMTANKVRGVRAAVVHDEFTTRMSREHNDANVLCAGARVLDGDAIGKLAVLWLTVPFGGGRHGPRVKKIEK